MSNCSLNSYCISCHQQAFDLATCPPITNLKGSHTHGDKGICRVKCFELHHTDWPGVVHSSWKPAFPPWSFRPWRTFPNGLNFNPLVIWDFFSLKNIPVTERVWITLKVSVFGNVHCFIPWLSIRAGDCGSNGFHARTSARSTTHRAGKWAKRDTGKAASWGYLIWGIIQF